MNAKVRVSLLDAALRGILTAKHAVETACAGDEDLVHVKHALDMAEAQVKEKHRLAVIGRAMVAKVTK